MQSNTTENASDRKYHYLMETTGKYGLFSLSHSVEHPEYNPGHPKMSSQDSPYSSSNPIQKLHVTQGAEETVKAFIAFYTKDGEGPAKVEVPYGQVWKFKHNWSVNTNEVVKTFTTNCRDVKTSSHAATMVEHGCMDEKVDKSKVKDVKVAEKDEEYWIKCSSLVDHFKNISMEINILNTLSQHPVGHRFFPRVLFYNFYNDPKLERRLLFGCTNYQETLEKRLDILKEDRRMGDLHTIRRILRQILEAICVFHTYGISSQLNLTNIRMKNDKLDIVVTNFNRATTPDHGLSNDDYSEIRDEYTSINLILKLDEVQLSEEWSAAVIAYHMLFGETYCHVADRKLVKQAIIYATYGLLGAPPKTLQGKEMRTWYDKKDNGKWELKAEHEADREQHFNGMRGRIPDLPRKLKDMKKGTFRTNTYNETQKPLLDKLVDVIEGMLQYDPNVRKSAEAILQFPFFETDVEKSVAVHTAKDPEGETNVEM